MFLDRVLGINLDPLFANPYRYDVADILSNANAASTAPLPHTGAQDNTPTSATLAALRLSFPTVFGDGPPDVSVGIAPPRGASADLVNWLPRNHSLQGVDLTFTQNLVRLGTHPLATYMNARANAAATSAGPHNYREIVAKLRKRFPQRPPGVASWPTASSFWSFNDANTEQLAKVLAASTLSQRYWTHTSGLTSEAINTQPKSRVPVLGELPVLGGFFRERDRYDALAPLFLKINPSLSRTAIEE